MDKAIFGILMCLILVTSGCVDSTNQDNPESEIEPSNNVSEATENDIEIIFGSNVGESIISEDYLNLPENRTIFSRGSVSFMFQIEGVVDYSYDAYIFSKNDYATQRNLEDISYREFVSNNSEQVQEVCVDQDETTLLITCEPENLDLNNLKNYIFTVVVESGNTSKSKSVEFVYSSPVQIGETVEAKDFSTALNDVTVENDSERLRLDYSIESRVEKKLDTNVYLVDDRSTPGAAKIIDSFNLSVEGDVERQDTLEFSEEDYPSHVVFQLESGQSYLVAYDLGDMSAEINENTEFISEGETYSTDNFEFSIDSLGDYEDETVDGLNKIEFDYYFKNKGIAVTEARDGIGAEVSLREDRRGGNIDYIRLQDQREGQSTEDDLTLEYIDEDNPQYVIVNIEDAEGIEDTSLILELN